MQLDLEKSDYKNYPELFSWADLKEIISRYWVSLAYAPQQPLNLRRKLALLRRHPQHQQAYDDWRARIIDTHGSIPSFILKERLGWVKPNETPPPTTPPAVHPTTPPYFTRNAAENHKLLMNDWGYAIPHNDIEHVEHWVCWSRLPLIHRDLFKDESDYKHALSNGLYGFTGQNNHEEPVDGAQEIHAWIEAKFSHSTETAYFLNPPHLQSVKEVEHFHIFVRN